MKDINTLLKEELLFQRKRNLNEQVLKLQYSKNKDKLIENAVITISNLLDDGYSLDEISKSVNEQDENIFTKFGGIFQKGLWGGLWSQVVEWISRWILDKLGLKPPASDIAAMAIGNLKIEDYKTLILMFKSPDQCMPGASILVDNILEGIVLYMQNKMGFSRQIFPDSLRNVIMDSVKQSNIGETIAQKVICQSIHGASSTVQTPPQTNTTNTTEPVNPVEKEPEPRQPVVDQNKNKNVVRV